MLERNSKVFVLILTLSLWSFSFVHAQEGGPPQSSEGIGAPVPLEVPEETVIETFGGDIDIEEGEPVEDLAGAPTPPPNTLAGVIPEIYEIQSKDTLWDICQKLLDNPWYWPKLWSLNQYILNPHEIYPGNQLTFYAGSETSPPKLDIVDSSGQSLEPVQEAPEEKSTKSEYLLSERKQSTTGYKTSGSVRLQSLSFISEVELDTVGEISHSGAPKIELVFGDPVYLDFYKRQKVSVGDRFHVIEKIRKVPDPEGNFSTLGWLMKRKAVAEITQIKKNIVQAVIIDSYNSVKRGDKIVPFEPTLRKVNPHTTSKQLVGKIVEAENQQFLISNNDFVFLNLGKQQGVDDGLEMVVVRRGDGIFPEDDKELPNVVVGRLLVVEARENTSSAYVLDLKNSLSIGDRVQNRVE